MASSDAWSVTTNPLPDGTKSVYFTYTPDGGRESDKSAVLTDFKVDQTAPSLMDGPGTIMPDPIKTLMRVGTSDEILVRLNISDPGNSGVASIKAIFASPTGDQTKLITFDVDDDHEEGNRWEKSFKLDHANVEGGTWYLQQVILTDKKGNVNTQTVDRTSESYLKDIEFEVNNLPSGKPVFNGLKKLGQTLKIDESTIVDPENSGSTVSTLLEPRKISLYLFIV